MKNGANLDYFNDLKLKLDQAARNRDKMLKIKESRVRELAILQKEIDDLNLRRDQLALRSNCVIMVDCQDAERETVAEALADRKFSAALLVFHVNKATELHESEKARYESLYRQFQNMGGVDRDSGSNDGNINSKKP